MEDLKISFRFKNLSALKEPNMNNPRRQGGLMQRSIPSSEGAKYK